MGKMFGYELHVIYKDPTYGRVDEYLFFNTSIEANRWYNKKKEEGIKFTVADLLSIEESYLTDTELRNL